LGFGIGNMYFKSIAKPESKYEEASSNAAASWLPN
jgi:hypothetical protein